MNITGIVLSGGKSTRMGSDKAQLEFHGKTLLDIAIKLLTDSGIKNTVVSGQLGIQDKYPNKGPIGGILSCLTSLKKYSHVVIIPVDMPLLTCEIIKELMNNNKENLSYFENYNLPLIIKNNETVRKILEKQISNNNLSLYDFFGKVNTKILKSKYNRDCFINTNSPQQWANATQKPPK